MQDVTEQLRKVFPQVLQLQIFMFAEEAPIESLPAEAINWMITEISFSGPFSGYMTLALPSEIQMEIAANFLGKDADDPDVFKYSEDALKEIINVLCGHMLTSIAGENPIFDLSIPTVTSLSHDQYEKMTDSPDSLCFDLEGKLSVVRISIDAIPEIPLEISE